MRWSPQVERVLDHHNDLDRHDAFEAKTEFLEFSKDECRTGDAPFCAGDTLARANSQSLEKLSRGFRVFIGVGLS